MGLSLEDTDTRPSPATYQLSLLDGHITEPVTSDCYIENHPKTCCLKIMILYISLLQF